MIKIPFRKYNFKIRQEKENPYIFDIIRSKFVKLLPEEWVRQNIIHYLIEDLNYPKGKFAVEKVFFVNGRRKRFDVLIYNESMHPFMIIECKAPEINITEETLNQVLQYNMKFGVHYVVLSNGNTTFCYDVSLKQWISNLPIF